MLDLMAQLTYFYDKNVSGKVCNIYTTVNMDLSHTSENVL